MVYTAKTNLGAALAKTIQDAKASFKAAREDKKGTIDAFKAAKDTATETWKVEKPIAKDAGYFKKVEEQAATKTPQTETKYAAGYAAGVSAASSKVLAGATGPTEYVAEGRLYGKASGTRAQLTVGKLFGGTD